MIKGTQLGKLQVVIADYHLPYDNGLNLLQEFSNELGRRPCMLLRRVRARSRIS